MVILADDIDDACLKGVISDGFEITTGKEHRSDLREIRIVPNRPNEVDPVFVRKLRVDHETVEIAFLKHRTCLTGRLGDTDGHIADRFESPGRMSRHEPAVFDEKHRWFAHSSSFVSKSLEPSPRLSTRNEGRNTSTEDPQPSLGQQRFIAPRPNIGMTDWRAVIVGFLVGLVASVFAFVLPVIGHMGAGLLAGFVSGYLAGGSIGRGVWHGLLAGALGGLVVAVLLAAVVSIVGMSISGPFGILGGVGVFVIGATIAALLAVDSAIGGAIGGVLSR